MAISVRGYRSPAWTCNCFFLVSTDWFNDWTELAPIIVVGVHDGPKVWIMMFLPSLTWMLLMGSQSDIRLYDVPRRVQGYMPRREYLPISEAIWEASRVGGGQVRGNHHVRAQCLVCHPLAPH